MRVPSESRLVQLARRLGVEILPGKANMFDGCVPPHMQVEGNEENGFAWLASPTVVAYDDEHSWPADDIFHEVMHAICGPECLGDEGPLMPVQWEMMKLLRGEEFSVCRKDFATYSLAFDNVIDGRRFAYGVGDTDEFLTSKTWYQLTDLAMAMRLLTQAAKPNWRYLKDASKWRKEQ